MRHCIWRSGSWRAEPAWHRRINALHHLVGLGSGDRLLDLACGAGLALDLAAARGASCSGIDDSGRLVAVARDRNPGAGIRTGLRLAFSTINAGLGATPDERLLASAPEQLCRAAADPLP